MLFIIFISNFNRQFLENNSSRPANLTDVEEIFQLFKAVYKIKMGDSSLAFENVDRYTTRTAVLKDLSDMWVMRSTDRNSKGRQIVACGKGSSRRSILYPRFKYIWSTSVSQDTSPTTWIGASCSKKSRTFEQNPCPWKTNDCKKNYNFAYDYSRFIDRKIYIIEWNMIFYLILVSYC